MLRRSIQLLLKRNQVTPNLIKHFHFDHSGRTNYPLTAREIIQQYNLKPHPKENGYFSDPELYIQRRQIKISSNQLLPLADINYFLYEEGDFCPWHRMLIGDEFWIHQSGGAMQVSKF